MIKGGLKVIDLPGERVLRAQQVIRAAPRLSVNDGFAFALAESCPGCILLTGDGCLRGLAVKQNIEVHRFLWIVDEIQQTQVARCERTVYGFTATGRRPACPVAGT